MNKNKNNDLLDLDLDLNDDATTDEGQLAVEKLEIVKQILKNQRNNIDRAIKLLEDSYQSDSTLVTEKLEEIRNGETDEIPDSDDGEVVEGVFDGQKMIGSDGREHQIPPNYVSKSKLVEGDILKLTMDNRGNFIYKQIGPIERKRVKAKIAQDSETGQYYALQGKKRWKLITAAVTYFKGKPG